MLGCSNKTNSTFVKPYVEDAADSCTIVIVLYCKAGHCVSKPGFNFINPYGVG